MAGACGSGGGSRESIVLLAVLLTLDVCVTRTQAEDCSHKYTEHLNHIPSCNPYPNGVLKMECTVEVPLNATDIAIGWFWNCQQLMNDSRVSIWTQEQILSEVRRVRSRLTISDLTDDYVGKYTCNMLGDVEYLPSSQLTLRDGDYLEVEDGLGPCPDNGFIFNPVAEDRCALITDDKPIPMSLVCDSPPSSQIHPTTSRTVIRTSTHSPSSSTPPPLTPTHTPSPPDVTLPSPSGPIVETTATTGQDPTSIWLYVVVAVAAVFFMIIVILAIICVGTCIWRHKGMDERTVTQQEVAGKHVARVQTNLGYSGEYFPDGHLTAASPQPPYPPDQVSTPPPYHTLGSVDYEVVGPGSNYERLERPTLKSGLMSRFGSSPTGFSPSTTMTSVYPMSATPTGRNGAPPGVIPPPLPSMSRPGGATAQPRKLSNSPESSATFDGVFLSGSVDVSSPMERDRMDSTSLLIPKEKRGSSTMGSGDFEGLYIPRQKHSPTSPQVTHPLQKIPETGASFPEPLDPYPFPSTSTYESIPGEETSSGTVAVAGYEKPLPYPNKSGYPRSVTMPVRSPQMSSPPPPSSEGLPKVASTSLMSSDSGENRRTGAAVTLSPNRHKQELEMNTISGPIYHSLEQSGAVDGQHHVNSTLLGTQLSHAHTMVVETGDFTHDSDSSRDNTLTPGFPVVSADFADMPTTGSTFPVSKVRPQRRQLASELSSDCTGDSDYPQVDDALTDFTGGSCSTAYPESDWTAGTTSGTRGNGTLTGDSAIFRFNSSASSQSGHSSSSTQTPTPSDAAAYNRYSGDDRPPSYDGIYSMSNGVTPAILPVNGMKSSSDPTSNGAVLDMFTPNGNVSAMEHFPQPPAGSSHTVPVSGGSGLSAGGLPSSQTISTPRNHYKRLDPSTMDPHLKYTKLNVGKLTAV